MPLGEDIFAIEGQDSCQIDYRMSQNGQTLFHDRLLFRRPVMFHFWLGKILDLNSDGKEDFVFEVETDDFTIYGRKMVTKIFLSGRERYRLAVEKVTSIGVSLACRGPGNYSFDASPSYRTDTIVYDISVSKYDGKGFYHTKNYKDTYILLKNERTKYHHKYTGSDVQDVRGIRF